MHLTETCDDDTPHLITHVATTPATTHDRELTATIHADLTAKGVAPHEHLVDTGYIDAELLVQSEWQHGVTLLGPVTADLAWQA